MILKLIFNIIIGIIFMDTFILCHLCGGAGIIKTS